MIRTSIFAATTAALVLLGYSSFPVSAQASEKTPSCFDQRDKTNLAKYSWMGYRLGAEMLAAEEAKAQCDWFAKHPEAKAAEEQEAAANAARPDIAPRVAPRDSAKEEADREIYAYQTCVEHRRAVESAKMDWDKDERRVYFLANNKAEEQCAYLDR